MKRYWEMACRSIDGMSLRERTMIFAAVAFVLIALIGTFLLDPLRLKQKALAAQVAQQQEKMKDLQAQVNVLFQAKQDVEHSPLRARAAQLKLQFQAQDVDLKQLLGRLVAPDKMAALLEQVLNKNGKLKLHSLNTLPPTPVMPGNAGQRGVFKHGVKIIVRGGYLDLLQYLSALEKLPVQLFWGDVSLTVLQHPDAEMHLTIYTLSFDQTWLSI